VATVVVVVECPRVVGGEGTAHEGLFSSERCPFTTARSFGSAVLLKTACSCRSKSEDDTVGGRSYLHLALEVNLLFQRFRVSKFRAYRAPQLGAIFALTGQSSIREQGLHSGIIPCWCSQERYVFIN